MFLRTYGQIKLVKLKHVKENLLGSSISRLTVKENDGKEEMNNAARRCSVGGRKRRKIIMNSIGP